MARAEQSDARWSTPSENLVEMLLQQAQRNPTAAAASVKVAGVWKDVSWGEVLERVRAVSNGLVAAGVRPGDRVALFADTSLTWCVVDIALHAARAISVPIYASNTEDEVRFIVEHSGASMLIIDSDAPTAKQTGRLTRALAAQPAAAPPQLVLWDGASPAARSLDALIEAGRGISDFEARARAIRLEDVSHILYTSGTTGRPKGVMLTHGNWAFEAAAMRRVGALAPDDAVMLFLPLAHSFAQAGKAAWLGMGFKMVFAEAVEKVVQNLAETRPTIMPTVPRVLEKVFAAVHGNATSASGVKGKLGRWAFQLFDEYVEARELGRPYASLAWTLAQRLVFTKVRATIVEKLGGRMRIFISGGAPLPRKIAYFFDLLGVTVCEAYGLTETSAGATMNRPEAPRIGTVGPPFPTVDVKIASDGEILLRGANVMRGYYRDEGATAEVLDPDGFFHTGDIGEIDGEGCIRITDRKKDMIKTSGGKYCAPQNLENALKTHGIISNSMVHGDGRPYLTVLICVNEESARKQLGTADSAAMSYAQLAAHPDISAAVQRAVDAVNAGLPPYSTLKCFALMDHDFSQETGELTPTLKVKRKFCTQKYAASLDAMYARPSSDA